MGRVHHYGKVKLGKDKIVKISRHTGRKTYDLSLWASIKANGI